MLNVEYVHSLQVAVRKVLLCIAMLMYCCEPHSLKSVSIASLLSARSVDFTANHNHLVWLVFIK